MNEIIYLEPDDDITAVIGRLKEVAPSSVSLVIPRGGNIAQSVVNLKLLKREVEKIGKQVSLVTNDKISRNLSSQVGVTVYSSVHEAKNARPTETVATGTAVPYTGQLKINRYDKEDDQPEEEIEEQKPIEDEDVVRPETPANEPPAEPAESIYQPLGKRSEPSAAGKPDRPVNSPSRGGVPNRNVPPSSRFKSRNVSSRKKLIIILASIFLVVALALTAVFLPRTDASIILKTEDIADNSAVTIDKNITEIDQANLAIPGTAVSADDELTKEFPATGSKNAGTKATGHVVFYNYDYNDANPKSIPAGTTLVASGKNFVTSAAVTIPISKAETIGGVTKVTPSISAKVTINASEAGEEYNLAASRFNIANYSASQRELVYAQSESALSGGTTKVVTVVSDSDISKAKEATKTELDQKITDDIASQISEDNQKIIDASVTITENSSESSKNPGDEVSSFTYKISAKGEAIAFSEENVRTVIVQKITTEIGADQMVVNPEKAEISYILKESKPDEGKIIANVGFVGKKGKKYNSDEIKKQITNKKYGTALSTIQGLAEVEKAELNIWPKFFPRTPIVESRVKVNFDYIK